MENIPTNNFITHLLFQFIALIFINIDVIIVQQNSMDQLKLFLITEEQLIKLNFHTLAPFKLNEEQIIKACMFNSMKW